MTIQAGVPHRAWPGARAALVRPLRVSMSTVAVPGVVMIVASAVAWLRLSSTVRGTLWAEDLRNFLSGDVHSGLAHTLLRPYGGYLQVAPRLIAALVAHLVPIEYWAVAVNVGACAVAGLVTAVVYVCAAQILNGRMLGLAAASITVLDPLAAHEVLGNLANLHWFVIWMMPWVLLYRPQCRWSAGVLGAVVLIAALSEFDVVLFLPLLLWRWRDPLLLTVRIPYLLGCIAEVIAEVASPRARPTHLSFGPADAISGYLINAVMSVVSPIQAEVGALLRGSGITAGIVLLAVAVALVSYVLRRGDTRLRIMAIVVSVFSPGLFISAVELTPNPRYAYGHLSSSQLADPWLVRYGVVPSMLLLALIPLAAASARRRRDGAGGRLASITAMAVLAVPLLAHAGPAADQLRARGPAFAPQVVEAVRDCRTSAPDQQEKLYAAPSRKWEITLSCRQLEHGARE